MGAYLIKHRDRGCQRKSQLLLGGRAGLLQVVRADIDRVPLGQVPVAIFSDITDQFQAWRGRKDIGAARKILLDDIVLHRAPERGNIRPLLLGYRDIKRELPGGGGVDGHRGVHPRQRNILKQAPHIAQVANRHANLANLAVRQNVIAVIAGLGGQIKSHAQPGLAFCQIVTVKRVGGPGSGMARIGAKQPWLVFGWHGFLLFVLYCTAQKIAQATILPLLVEIWNIIT